MVGSRSIGEPDRPRRSRTLMSPHPCLRTGVDDRDGHGAARVTGKDQVRQGGEGWSVVRDHIQVLPNRTLSILAIQCMYFAQSEPPLICLNCGA